MTRIRNTKAAKPLVAQNKFYTSTFTFFAVFLFSDSFVLTQCNGQQSRPSWQRSRWLRMRENDLHRPNLVRRSKLQSKGICHSWRWKINFWVSNKNKWKLPLNLGLPRSSALPPVHICSLSLVGNSSHLHCFCFKVKTGVSQTRPKQHVDVFFVSGREKPTKAFFVLEIVFNSLRNGIGFSFPEKRDGKKPLFSVK